MHVQQGDEHSIEITAREKTLDKIIVEIDDDKLIIRFSFEDRWMSNFEPGTIEINVVTPEIEMLSVQGSGDIYAEGLIETFKMELNVAGSGDIKLSKLDCEVLDADIAGSGDIVLSGKSTAREMDINIAGSGDIVAHQFKVETAEVKIAGSGDCEVFVTDRLDVKIFGSGDVIYKGDPHVNSNISGSGKIHKR